MKLISCHVSGFGTLSNFDYSFEDGLSVLVRENGWGKTTFAAFVKAMLYGLPRSTKQKLDENERKKYTPWRGGIFGGELVFSVGGKEYRVERTFGETDTFHLYDTKTERESFDFSENLGDELFGINAAAYERSTFFPQYELTKSDAQTSVTAKLNGLISAESDINAYDHAIVLLDAARKRYKLDRGTGGKIDELNERKNELRRKKQDAETASERLNQLSERAENGKKVCEETRLALERAEKEYGDAVTEKSNLDRLNHYRHLVEQISAKQSAFLAEEAFFGGKLPTEEEIAAFREAEETVTRLEGEKNAVDLSSLEGDAERFEQIPTEEESGELRECAVYADGLCRRLEQMTVLGKEEYTASLKEKATLEEAAKEQLPSYEEIEERRRIAEEESRQAQEERNTFLSRGVPVKKIGRSVWLIGSGIATILLGAGLFFVLPYLAAISLVGVALIILGAAYAVGEKKAYLRDCEDYEEEEERLTSVAASKEKAVSDLWELFAQRRRRDEDARRKEYLEREIERYEQFNAFLGELKEYETILAPLSLKRGESFVQAWSRYEQSRRNAVEYSARKRTKEELEEKIRTERGKIALFAETFHTTAEDAKNRLARHAFYRSEWEKAKETKKAFEAEHALDERFLERVFTDRTQETDEKRRYYREKVRAYEEEYGKICRNMESLTEQACVLPDVEAELAAVEEESVEASHNHQVLAWTKKYMEEAKGNLSARYLDKLKEGFSSCLSLFGGEKLGKFTMDIDQSVKFRAEGQTQKAESLSKGWKSVLALSVRFAFVEALFPDEKPFLILDDPFADLDEENFRVARDLLERMSERYQILYLICHESRK